MKDIEEFTENGIPAPQRGKEHADVIEAPEIIEYLKEESNLRFLFVPKNMGNRTNEVFEIEKEEGVAVHTIGNAEVPRHERIRKWFAIYLQRNATGYGMSIDPKQKANEEPGAEAKKYADALKRMERREQLDMLAVFNAAPLGESTATALTVAAIRGAIKKMLEISEIDYVDPDVIFMNKTDFLTLQTDPDFKFVPEIYNEILKNARINTQGERARYEGPTGQYIQGLEIHILNALPAGQQILVDSTKEGLWLAEGGAPFVIRYTDYEHMEEYTDIRHDEQPVCIERSVLHKLTITGP